MKYALICGYNLFISNKLFFGYSVDGAVSISSAEIWMSEMELVVLFGVIAPTLRTAIKAIYKNSGLCPTSAQRYSSYNLEVIIALAFRLNTYEANMIRQKILKSICQRKENIGLFISFRGRLQAQS